MLARTALLLTLSAAFVLYVTRPACAEWKAAVARVKITPEKNMWMAGYAARKTPSEGTVQELYAKALALEDEQQTRLVIVTLDLIGVPRELREWLEQQVQREYDLPPSGLLLNASHTHCGPELRINRLPAEGQPEEAAERRALAEAYMQQLQQKLVALVGEALQATSPAKLDYLHARCGFAMNRRRPTERGYINSPYSDGPVDQRVPVLRVSGEDGSLRALLFGYACHNTTMGFNFFCGDYAGYAQQYLEQEHPEATAMFLMGCGGDQNPYPRRKLEHCEQHGRALANAVEAALETVPRPITGPLRLAYDTVALKFAPPPTREQLVELAATAGEPASGHARRLLAQLEADGEIRETYEYPLQTIGFGSELLLVAMAGETVVDYSLRLQKELAAPVVWVAGYSNDVFGYVPSLRVLQEGGYEAGGAMLWGPLPGPFAPDVEQLIVDKVHALVQQLQTTDVATSP